MISVDICTINICFASNLLNPDIINYSKYMYMSWLKINISFMLEILFASFLFMLSSTTRALASTLR